MPKLEKYFISVSDLEWYNRQLYFNGFHKQPDQLQRNDCFAIVPEAGRVYAFMVIEKAINHFAYICWGISATDQCFDVWKIKKVGR